MRKTPPNDQQPQLDSGDLALFGFDVEGDHWLSRFGDAAVDEPLAIQGSYEILEELGRGGQGIVYRVRRRNDGHVFAMKRLLRGTFATPDERNRFEREFHAIQALNHPNIADAYGIDVANSDPHIILEFVDGEPLNKWAWPNDTRRDVDTIVALFANLCDAVHHAHVRGILHRDIKPANVIIVEDALASKPRPVILDFGMARFVSKEHRTGSFSGGLFAGTLAYAAPEQLDGVPDNVDARTDIYSIGAMLYEALIGRTPIETAGSLTQAVRSIAETTPQQPSRLSSDLSRDLDAIILKSLAKDRAERYQSVEAMAEDLRRYLSGDPVLAQPPSTIYLAGKLIKRHPIGFTATVLGIVGMTILSVLLYTSREREREAHARAETTKNFLADTLMMADPARGGANVSLLEVLDKAGSEIDPKLGDRPENAAAVHLAIGKTYNSLWKWNEALPHLENAVALYRNTGDSEPLANALYAYGKALTSLRKPEAVDTHREALGIRQELIGGDDPAIAESLKGLAYALQQASDPPNWDEAEQRYEEALAMYRRTLGDDDPATGSCLHNYGWMRVRQKRIVDAEELYRQALEVFRRAEPRDDASLTECLYGYTAQLEKLGRHADNIEALSEFIPLLKASHGAESAIGALQMKAKAYRLVGDYEAAMTVHADLFTTIVDQLRKDELQPQIPIGATQTEFAADALCDYAIELAKDTPKESFLMPFYEAIELCECHTAAGRLIRASEILDSLETVVTSFDGDTPWMTCELLASRSEIAAANNEYGYAIELMVESLDALSADGIPGERKRITLQFRLAQLYESNGDFHSASMAMDGVVAKMNELFGPDYEITKKATQWEFQLIAKKSDIGK